MEPRRDNPLSRPPRLLIISYHFVPDGFVGGLRWAGLSKYLARSGWEVQVVTAAAQSGAVAQEGVKIHVVERAATLNDAYNTFARRLRGSTGAANNVKTEPVATLARMSPGAETSSTGRTPMRVLQQLRAELSAWLAFPDYSRGWLFRAGSYARKLVRHYEPDLVVTSGPPHTAHLAGLLATLGRSTPVLMDMRDPWISFVPKTHRTIGSALPFRRFALYLLERLSFKWSAGVITNAQSFAAALSQRWPHLAVRWLPNGVDLERLPEPNRDPIRGLQLAYVGTMHVRRDLEPVFRAMGMFFTRHPAAAGDGSTLRVAGHAAGVQHDRIQVQLSSSGVQEHVQLLGVLPAQDALALLNSSSLAIVLAQDQGIQVPAKLYESIGLRLTTLVIAEPDSASAREAKRIGAILRSPDDVAGICALFEQVWSGQMPSRRDPAEPIDYAHLATRMSDLLLTFAPSALPSTTTVVPARNGVRG
ncbi:MAG: glycosyltransferase [Longimicrobiales bacterium]